MTGRLILCWLVFTFSFALGQNYQTIKSTDINYFGSPNNDYILATKIDSVEVIAGDSIFYPFKSIREYYGSNPNCFYYRSPSWMGSMVIIQSDGMNLFINSWGDTIHIDTQADIGTTFQLYYSPSTFTVNATVTSITEEVVLDMVDSVKTYTLSSASPFYNFPNEEIRIGKYSGLISMFPFYSFPEVYEPLFLRSQNTTTGWYELIGREYPKTGITKPTCYDVYNLEIGDNIQLKEWNTGTNSVHDIYVISKTLLPFDSVEYVFVDQYGLSINNVDTIIERYSIADVYVTPFVPEELAVNQSGSLFTWNDETMSMAYNEECGYRLWVNSLGGHIIDTLDMNCFNNWHWPYTGHGYYSGAGSFYHYYNNMETGTQYGAGLVSKTNSGVVCGNPVVLETELIDHEPYIRIFPNPFSDGVHIESDEVFDLMISDFLGQEIMSFQSLTNQIEVDLSNYPSGIYFFNITSGENHFIRKVIKK